MSFRATLVALAQRKSSKVWLSRQSSDPWVKQRAQNDYYSRSAFKLLEISENYGNFLDKHDVGVVIDLGAAPGGWSQAAARKLGWDDSEGKEKKPGSFGLKQEVAKKGKVQVSDTYDPLNIDNLVSEYGSNSPDGRPIVVAVDLLPIKPIPGVQSIQANFLHSSTEGLIHDVLARFGFGQRNADIILSDIAANMTGVAAHDDEASLQICRAVWQFAKKNLRTATEIGRTRGGVLLLKHFTHPDVDAFRQKCLVPNFRDVTYIKPRSSRSESKEAYYLCRGFEPETMNDGNMEFQH
ncbi:23S ribosomal RNA methyltransferase [Marasmius fiardii PR-910]|nr:23S ribosomal RNA methyltransferase [Marasmius fiardii PR-910]